MRKLKKFFIFILTFIVAILPTACGGRDNDKGSTSSSQISVSSISKEDNSMQDSAQISESNISSSSYDEQISESNISTSSYDEQISESNISDSSFDEQTSTTTLISNSQSSSNSQECNHSYEQTEFVEPTLSSNGFRKYECSSCSKDFQMTIPKLDTVNYTVRTISPTCTEEGMDVYSSTKYGNFFVKTGGKLAHTTYEGYCDMCHETINNLYFDQKNAVKVYNGGGYPRLIELNDGRFLCGFDTGHQIRFMLSSDKGKTWTNETVVRDCYDETLPENGIWLANVAFYQFENGDILCAYRMIGQTGQTTKKFVRRIECSISQDNGATWSNHSVITDAYNLGYDVNVVDNAIANEGRLGFFEPHFGIINNKLTVMYADDLTTMLENPRGSQVLNYETQYIISKQWVDNSWGNYNIVLNGTVLKTVGGITDFSRDGMPVFDRLHDGTYVLAVEGTYRRTALRGNNPFIILLSYSEDGVNWSTPVEAYVPYINGAKASAPFVCVTEDDRLVISFQTDEDANGGGDGVSIMKTIISDGTPIKDIKGRENFLEAQNVFGTAFNHVSSWNGMMLKGDTLYCVSGTNWGGGGVQIQSTKIPKRDAGTYTQGTALTNFTVRNGSAVDCGNNWIKTTGTNSLVTKNDLSVYNGTISVDVMPKSNVDCGLVFRQSSTANSFWEANSSYYVLLVNWEGLIMLGKITNGSWQMIFQDRSFIRSYNVDAVYNLKVELNDNIITCYANGKRLISTKDTNVLTGNGVGVRSGAANTWFYNLNAKTV